ncbi:DUF2309 domain-containing protein [Fulvivirga sp. 29W222]|uniref:Probable inorganic carbon transporter subunit DabA n=1 Tax=Fulvivirga marina TaxID=2494733 RepID=A0A937G0G1_9BACT|nr:DUF2309 domain-containing protein [Fulvivirga marina]MBL6448242.1 DUF2309 domain-containing protein [Fulvivirga marina]
MLHHDILELSNDTRYSTLLKSMRRACKKIAPVWPLGNFVAVNPYLGLTHKKFENAAQELATAGGVQMTLPVSFYLEKFDEGSISEEDIETVLRKDSSYSETSVDDFIRAVKTSDHENRDTTPVPTVADIATQLTGKDWNSFITSRISAWAASYFDKGQATWVAANQDADLFEAWKFEAEIDRAPEITGLKKFREKIKAYPNDPLEATLKALEILRIPEDVLSMYFHRLLLKVGGWSAYAARLDYDSELNGGNDGKLINFLAVLTCWEASMLDCINHEQLEKKWRQAKIILSVSSVQKELNQVLVQKLILQEAFDLAAQREIINKFHNAKPIQKQGGQQSKVQAVFCIDVRSEVFRRNLERVDSEIETLGFAGFFGFPIKYVPIGHADGQEQCPVLLKPGSTVLEEIPGGENSSAVNDRIRKYRLKQIWKAFKSGAITCFSFVSPVGLSYLPKLFMDSFGLTRPVPHPDKVGLKNKYIKKKGVSLEVSDYLNQTVGIPMDQRVQMAKNALNAMSLTENFAKYVLIVGHGSTSVNNPHATGLDCGACAGHSGEANAKVAAAILNDRVVRGHLRNAGIVIPDSATFLACLHDTTTDEIRIFNENDVPNAQRQELVTLKESLAGAGRASRRERAFKMMIDGDVDREIKMRSKDWSQIRPEWGLAGCSTFVVAQRDRTKSIDFEGRSFLHSYDWKKDQGFAVLELIMTAPMVVTSWINLQYYGSAVDNKHFGSGNKALHNVTAGIGVLEGYSGDLRVGLPMQSVHDGEDYVHEPLKLNVIIEAPLEAINIILQKHQSVRDLCDNGWLHLLALNEEGKVSHRYEGNLKWEEIL